MCYHQSFWYSTTLSQSNNSNTGQDYNQPKIPPSSLFSDSISLGFILTASNQLWDPSNMPHWNSKLPLHFHSWSMGKMSTCLSKVLPTSSTPIIHPFRTHPKYFPKISWLAIIDSPPLLLLIPLPQGHRIYTSFPDFIYISLIIKNTLHNHHSIIILPFEKQWIHQFHLIPICGWQISLHTRHQCWWDWCSCWKPEIQLHCQQHVGMVHRWQQSTEEEMYDLYKLPAEHQSP